ncbi:hypothetical protein LCGC14_2148430 [marine sediment metagenome]|uniref:Uncharacterized protein n=1 Tax=marine sediment metagenome TaxID=412755 RepID=A0A0F9EIF6_9ZZZZ
MTPTRRLSLFTLGGHAGGGAMAGAREVSLLGQLVGTIWVNLGDVLVIRIDKNNISI